MAVSPWFLLLQTLAGTPLGFDLAKLKPADPCASSKSGEILVCAARNAVSDPEVTGPPAEEAMPRAEIGLFGDVRGSVQGQQTNVGGFPSKRIVVTVTAPF